MTRIKLAMMSIAVCGVLSVSACASGPSVTTYKVLTAATDTTPISVAAPLVARQTTGTQYNQWGGIIPEAKPTTPVDDDGLGEL